MIPRRHALAALLLALLLVLPHLVFLAVDGRPPNDHDTWYTQGVADSWTNSTVVQGAPAKARVVAEHFLFEGWHPQLAQTVLLIATILLGPSLWVFKGINLLFWALLVGSIYAVGRQLRSHRFGLLAMLLVAWLPGVLVYARKWEPMFHGSAFSALAWALSLRCLAPDAARLRWPWVALGLTLGARFYTHPTGLPDLGLTLGLTPLLALLLARRRGEPLGPVARRGAGMAFTALAMGAWFLGLLPLVPDEPSYALPHYLKWRASYVGGGDMDQFTLHRQLAGLDKLRNALWAWHWHPVPSLALGIPGLAALPRLVRAAPLSGHGLLAALLLVQLPLVHVTFVNGAVTPDWFHLLPLSVVLAASGLWGLVELGGRWAPAGKGLLAIAVLYGAWAAFMPQAVSLFGPDPLGDSREYQGRLLAAFQQIDTGDRQETPHLLSRHEQAGDVVAKKMAAAAPLPPGSVAVLAVQDLTLVRPGSGPGSPLCGGDLDHGCCDFAPGPRGGPRDRFQPAWPFRFAGWAGVHVVSEPSPDARFVLVRLWHADDHVGPLFEGQAHEPPASTAVSLCVDAAERWVAARYPTGSATLVPDSHGRLISRMWAYRSEYAHRAFLVDRGQGTLRRPAQVRSPMGGALPAP